MGAILEARVEYENLGDPGRQLFTTLIRGEEISYELSKADYDAMRSVKDLKYPYKRLTFKPIAIAINYALAAARLALQAIRSAA